MFGMIQRGGEVVRRREPVPPITSKPRLHATIAPGTCVDTEEDAIDRRWDQWRYAPKRVGHGPGEEARDDDGDGVSDVPVNPREGVWSLLRSWWRPQRGISPDN